MMRQSEREVDGLHFTLTHTPDSEVREFLHQQIRTFNDQHSEQHRTIRTAGPSPLYVLLRDEAGKIVGGLIGSTYWSWLEIEYLWLEDRMRRNGYGRRLLQMAEAEAQARGCLRVMLTTFSFQARGFYEKQGYRVVGELADYPPGESYYWMRKDL